jgi:membrane protease YdiL (CAAX protease family)
MYVPLLSSVITRLVWREGFSDISFKWGGAVGTRASLAAWLLPVVVGAVAYGIAWATGLATFTAPTGGMLAGIGSPILRFLAMIPLALTIGTVMSCLSAFGEEVGWRGYLVPRLVEGEFPAPFLVSALIWCAWHTPLILWGGYAVGSNPMLSVLLFCLSITPVGLLYARWRMASGSVWPCVIAHGAWNVVIQGVFDPFAPGEAAKTWIGESGVLTVVTMWVVFALIQRASWSGAQAVPERAAVAAGTSMPRPARP